MKNTFLTLITLFCFQILPAQQFFIEAFTGFNRTAYDLEAYNSQDWYMPVGFRIAGGLEHVQLGAEFHTDISPASFEFNETPSAGHREEFRNTYYGGLLRFNLSQMPAYRLGLIFKAGAGMYTTTKRTYSLPGESEMQDLELEYGALLGFNGGIGLSIPIQGSAHWEIGYVFNYVQRPEESNFNTPKYNAPHHSIQLGFSWNMVFGAAAKKHTHYKENKRWRNGWRG